MPSGIKERLSEILIKRGIISEEKLNQALQVQKEKGGSLGEILVSQGAINQRDLLAILSQELGIPPISLSKYKIDPEISKFIPKKIAVNYQIMPVSRMGNVLTVAMSDPMNVFALDDIKNVTGMEISPIITTADDVKAAIEQNYGSAATIAIEDLVKETNIELISMKKDEDGSSYDLKEAAIDTPVVKLTGAIVLDATKARASDILIEPMEDRLRIRYKIDGIFSEAQSLPRTIQSAMISRIKVMSNLNIAERRLPQDGRFKIRVQEREVDFRVSTVPTAFGEKVALRILDKSQAMLDVDKLGFEKEPLDELKKASRRPHGMILVCGPAGSGKTTTLYSVIKHIDAPEKNFVTVEDPVEYLLPGINQVNINTNIGLTYAACLRSILRQDPNVIMVGEIRDPSRAGSMVFSTLHARDAVNTVTRLMDMGVEPFFIATALTGIVSQRLIRLTCRDCAGQGCKQCNFTGFRRRIGVFEVLRMNDPLRQLILKRPNFEELKAAAIGQGMVPFASLIEPMIKQGLTTAEEVNRVLALE